MSWAKKKVAEPQQTVEQTNPTDANDLIENGVIKVSTKRPLFFYADKAIEVLQQRDDVTLSGLGTAISRVVTVGEVLVSRGTATYSRIETGLNSDSGRYNKPQIEVVLVKTPEFDSLIKIRDETVEAKAQAREEFDKKQAEFQTSLNAKYNA
eukprot:TRINITY_DN10977_c0_g1_i1.p1 TRINITY_DN10977_c0_g1~~TRINITY_DN10977_c0_g1_i1.p1  ORF type:complete len:152 (-),score=41.08 TRINITY_DN10977_c0_g1_i1:42-497(-)